MSVVMWWQVWIAIGVVTALLILYGIYCLGHLNGEMAMTEKYLKEISEKRKPKKGGK